MRKRFFQWTFNYFFFFFEYFQNIFDFTFVCFVCTMNSVLSKNCQILSKRSISRILPTSDRKTYFKDLVVIAVLRTSSTSKLWRKFAFSSKNFSLGYQEFLNFLYFLFFQLRIYFFFTKNFWSFLRTEFKLFY